MESRADCSNAPPPLRERQGRVEVFSLGACLDEVDHMTHATVEHDCRDTRYSHAASP